MRKLDETLEGSETNSDRPVSRSGTLPTDTEMEQFFNNLSLCDTKPAILSLVPPHSDSYIPKASLSNFPKPLPSLRTSDSCKLNYPDLLNSCEKVSIEITDDMSQAVEKETRKQSKTPLWFKYRAGRVTASRMKAVCHTDVTNPAQSLVKSICVIPMLSALHPSRQAGVVDMKSKPEKGTKKQLNPSIQTCM